jgi:hypothetical protein
LLAADPLPAVPGAPAELVADPRGDGLRVSVDSFELEPVTAAELAGASNLPQSTPRLLATARDGGLRADGGLQVSSLPATIERELPAVWEYRRNRGDRVGNLPRVRVEIEDSTGSGFHVGGRGKALQPVQVRASQVSRRDDGDGTEVFVGGVTLVIPIETLQAYGRMRTRLRIIVEGI